MKHTYLILLFLITVSACKKNNEESLNYNEALASNDIETIKSYLNEIEQEEKVLTQRINALNERLDEIDSTRVNYDLVTTVQPIDTSFNHFVEVQGSVMTKDDSQIFPEMNGVMTRLYVSEGQYIRKGKLIATVDDGGLSQQIAQQQVQLELARTTYERQKRLWEQNIGSEIQYLQAKNNYEAMQKGIAAMEKQLQKTKVYAPFSGSVEQVITKQGQVVSPGATPIIRLVGLGSLYVEAEVPETYLPTVNRGTKAVVRLDAIDKEFNSKVRRVNSTINPASRSFTIEVALPNDKLVKPNLIANLKLNDYSNKNAILIPGETVNEDAQGNQFVYVVDEMVSESIARVKRVVVETGKTDEKGWIEILNEDFDASKKVVAEGARSLVDGDEVEILPYENSRNN